MPILWWCGWGRASFLGMSVSPLVRIRWDPEFAALMPYNRSNWPRWLAWHGWLPMFSTCSPLRFLMGGLWAMFRTWTWMRMPAESLLLFLVGCRRSSGLNTGRPMPVHLGIASKNVRNVGKLISGWTSAPLCLCNDGDLLTCISHVLRYKSMLFGESQRS